METLTVRFSEDDLEAINRYAEEKKTSQAGAVRELVQLALRIEAMKKDGGNDDKSDEENLKKVTLESAVFSIETGYLARSILMYVMGGEGKIEGKTAKEIRAQAITVAKTFVKTTMGIRIDD